MDLQLRSRRRAPRAGKSSARHLTPLCAATCGRRRARGGYTKSRGLQPALAKQRRQRKGRPHERDYRANGVEQVQEQLPAVAHWFSAIETKYSTLERSLCLAGLRLELAHGLLAGIKKRHIR